MESSPSQQKLIIRNYSRAALKKSLDALKDVLQTVAAEKPAPESDWLQCGEPLEQLIMIIVENVNGRELEKALDAHGPFFQKLLRSQYNACRMSTKTPKGERFNGNIWPALFASLRPPALDLLSFQPVFVTDVKRTTCYDEFSKFLLTEAELESNNFPLDNEPFKGRQVSCKQ